MTSFAVDGHKTRAPHVWCLPQYELTFAPILSYTTPELAIEIACLMFYLLMLYCPPDLKCSSVFVLNPEHQY